MNPLPEEIAIETIFKIAKSFGLRAPEMNQVDFYTSSYSLGRANTKILQICANYSAGEMSLDNPRFVETVCHELVHYNGEMNHGPIFWCKCRKLTEQTINTLNKQKGERQ